MARALLLIERMVVVGELIGNYRVLAKLGEGAMGSVFLAQHPVIGRKVAIKLIAPEHARNVEMVTRFVDEARAIQQVGHEHIVDITDFGRTAEGEHYFIMEHLEGEPLSAWIARGPSGHGKELRALRIAAQIADALAASHGKGIIHRDLKPENVFLINRRGSDEFVKVLDFGVAKLLRGPSVRTTSPGIMMGTPLYMAPEQCEGTGNVDERADIYALGVVLFEMLTGRPPFAGDTIADVIAKKLTLEIPPVSAFVPDLPPVVAELVGRALARNPAKRYPSMAAFRDAIIEAECAREFAGELVAPSESSTRTASGALPLGPSLAAQQFTQRSRRRSPLAFVGVAALVSALVTAGFYAGFVPRVRPTTPAHAEPPSVELAPAARPAAPPSATGPVVVPLPPEGARAPDVSRPAETDQAPVADEGTQQEANGSKASAASSPSAVGPARKTATAKHRTKKPAPAPARRTFDDEDNVLAPSFMRQ